MPAILVPTDFSDLARAAYPFARRLAQAVRLPLRLAHVINYMGPSKYAVPGSPAEQHNEELERKMKAEAALLRGDTDIETLTVVREGLPAKELIRLLDADHAFGVLGCHHYGPLRRLLPGKVTSKVLRHTEKPVLVVPEGAHQRDITRVLLPVDFSEFSTGALAEAFEVSAALKASVTLVHALRETEDPDTAMASLDKRVAAAEEAGLTAESKLLDETRDPAGAVCEFATASDPDLMIMPAHGYHGFSRFVLGSVTEKIIQTSSVPVLVLKPEKTFGELDASLD
jgi:nucleotide-binding universal stress UspA family protein